jgi:hypothetical protein
MRMHALTAVKVWSSIFELTTHHYGKVRNVTKGLGELFDTTSGQEK